MEQTMAGLSRNLLDRKCPDVSSLLGMIRSGFSHIPTEQPHRQPASNYRKTLRNPPTRSPPVPTDILIDAQLVQEPGLCHRADTPTLGHGAAAANQRVDGLTDIPISKRKVQIYRD
ncbi:hypothetical protein INR49_006851 [Caranx melampygus]|nr:hypothetical protein INR49_006851 [Caranx melampygus]